MNSEFQNTKAAAELLREERWASNVVCVSCNSDDVVKNGVRNDFIQQYACNKCGRSFNDRSDTIFGRTQMKLTECLYIIYNIDRKSVNFISDEIDRSWKTVNDFIRLYNSSLLSSSIVEDYVEKASASVDYSVFGCGSNLATEGEENHL